MHVAIIGAGGAGCCAALELAQSGVRVDLFEREPQLIQGASKVNEGKIHQGFIYAKDDPDHTARLMARGALTFREYLSRWIDVNAALVLSTPFVYAVHEETMLSPDRLAAHYAACCRIFEEERATTGLSYLGVDEPAGFYELGADERAGLLNPDRYLTAFQTTELAVDPRAIAAALAERVEAEDRIALVSSSVVRSVERRPDGRFMIDFEGGARQSAGPYDQVVNAAWDGRLAIDRSMGLNPPHPWSYRHKFGSRVSIPLETDDLPSVTSVLGPLGDIVNFGANGFFLSWYPTGMIEMSTDLAPPDRWRSLTRDQRLDVYRRSKAHWRELCPLLTKLDYSADRVDPASGTIFAWGDTDVSDADSLLHSRYEVGVHTLDGYHSANTGKYTLVPLVGLTIARRVLDRAVDIELTL